MRRRTLAIAVTLSATLAALSLSAASAEPSWHAKGTGLLDCNGHSPVQRVVKQLQCAEIAANEDDGFEDNGHYVGHDEADIGWFSTQPGSSTRARWNVTLPVDPPGPASTSFSGPVADFQLTVALVRHGALRQREVGIDRHMRAIAVWGATRGGKSRIEASELTVTKGGWSPPAELAEASQMLLVPQIAVNARGDAVAAWKRWRGGAPLSPGGVRDPIAAAVKPSGRRSWLAPVTLGTEFEPPLQDVAAFEFSGPHVAIDARGDAAVVWQGRYGRTIVPEASAMDAGGRWQTPTPIATTFALYPHVAMDRNGDATAVWQGPRGSVVAASKPRMAGGWSTQQTIYHGNPNITPYPQVSVGSHGEAIATWSGNPVQAAVRPGPGAAWQHPVRLGFGGGTAD